MKMKRVRVKRVRPEGQVSSEILVPDILEAPGPNQRDARIAIFYFFWNALECPPEEEWKGDGGAIAQTRKAYPNLGYNTILRVFEAVYGCMALGIKYNADDCYIGSGGSNKMIQPGTKYEQIIADAVEAGAGYTTAMHIVNIALRDDGKVHVGRSAVRSCVLRLNPLVTAISPHKQAGSVEWAKARMRWATQLLLRLKELRFDDLEEDEKEEEYYKLDRGFFQLEDVAFWDETHKVTHISGDGRGGKQQIRFRRDKDQKLCDDGTFNPEFHMVNVKYSSENRWCCGVRIDDVNGEPVGKRLPTLEYTERQIVSHEEYMGLVEKEIRRVKQSRASHYWVKKRPARHGPVFREDPIDEMKGVRFSVTTIAALKEAGIAYVRDIANMEWNVFKELNIKGIRRKTFTKAVGIAKRARVGAYSGDVDYRKFPNPYEARFGGTWKAEIAKAVKAVSIRDVVTHMFKHSPGLVYHDALSLMTSRECARWMKTAGSGHPLGTYYDRWILPIKNLNAGSYWANQPVGNIPELMPLDCCLFGDLVKSLNRHVALTFHLPEDDPRKFSRSTTRRQRRAFERLWDPELQSEDVNAGVPGSDRIVQDINKFTVHLWKIREAKGNAVHGLGNSRNGHRYIAGLGSRGGVREKSLLCEGYVHPDAAAARKERIFESISIHSKK